jgi:hypothetical protein
MQMTDWQNTAPCGTSNNSARPEGTPDRILPPDHGRFQGGIKNQTDQQQRRPLSCRPSVDCPFSQSVITQTYDCAAFRVGKIGRCNGSREPPCGLRA